jgi:hypothetical protein
MTSTARVPVCVTLPPGLIERADRIAEADERSRSYVVTRALQTYCDSIEIPPPAGRLPVADAVRSADGAAAGPGAPSRAPAAASYPASLHIDTTQRQAAAKRMQAAETAQAHDAALNATTDYLTKLGKGDPT